MSPEPYGILDGEAVQRLVLEAPGLRVAILTYGGLVERLEIPDRNGAMGNVVLGLDSLDAYVEHSPYFGAVVGRYANRIAHGHFMLDGQDHMLPCNDGPNSLHGGTRGFSKRVWRIVTSDARHVELAYTSPDGEEGYPGRLEVRVTYTLEAEGALRISYRAETDAPTVVNLSHHDYWNLAGEGSGTALDHELLIEADHFTPVDATMIPTGELRAVAGTPFDFRRATPVGARIRAGDAQLLIGQGYDHNWVLRGGVAAAPRTAARLRDPASGRTLELLTDQPGLQVYSGNQLDGRLVGPGGRIFRAGDAIALEPQHFPDSPNHPDFPPTVLRPGEVFRSTTVLRFGVEP